MSIYDSLNEQQKKGVFTTQGPGSDLGWRWFRQDKRTDQENCLSDREYRC